MTSQSITGRKGFPNYDLLGAMIASALKKLLTHMHFRKRVIVKEQRAQKDDRSLRGRQIAYMIHEHFRATGAYEALQGLSDLFKKRLQNDDVQDFDTRWDPALLAAKEKNLRKWSWCGLYLQNCRTLISFRLSWLCATNRIYETTKNRAIPD